MSDDVERTLEALEQRLRGLEAELEGAAAPPRPAAPPPHTPAPPDARPEAEAATDPLDQFGVELRRLATELVAAWDRVVAHERATARTRHTLVIEAQADLHALAALERALGAAPGVTDVGLRAYAGGHASLVVELS